MATLRRDGAPRLSGTEVAFEGGELVLGMMRGALRAHDLRRDARVALHTHSLDPPEDDPGSWAGEAVVSGAAIEVSDPWEADGPFHFRVEVGRVVLTRIGSLGDHLVIEAWRPGQEVSRRERRSDP
jgi:hypothetical protein